MWPSSSVVSFRRDAAPQRLVVALARAALEALEHALYTAHPILPLTSVRNHDPPELTDTEYQAALVLAAGNHLAVMLEDYTAAVLADLREREDDDELPF